MECLVSNYAQANLLNTSTRRKQILVKMNTVIADLDSSMELPPPSHPKPAITQNLKKGPKNVDCSLKQIIRLVKCDECEFVARNKEKLKSHTRKPHDVKETDRIMGRKLPNTSSKEV